MFPLPSGTQKGMRTLQMPHCSGRKWGGNFSAKAEAGGCYC